jgi:signal transduction histidine kinase
MKLPLFTNKIINLGLNPDVPFAEVRRIAIVNTLSMLIVAIGLLACSILVLMDPTFNVFWVGLSVAAFASTPLFANYFKQYLLAKRLFVSLFVFMYLAVSLCYGRNGHGEYSVIFIPAFSFILFDRYFRYFLFIFSLISLLGMQYVYSNFEPILVLPNNIFFLAYTGIVFMVCFFFVMDYYHEETVLAENKLKEKNLALEILNEKLNLANEHLYQFTSIASHDMREPLRTISNFSKILRKKTTQSDTSSKYLDFIEDSAQRLSQMIEDLIDYGRIGINEKELEEVDLNKVIYAVEQNLLQLMQDENAVIEVTNTLPKALGHNTLWIQLMQNIINNGIKYHRNGVAPRIKITSEQTTCKKWILKISDNGIGIDGNFFDKIFEPFRRLHSHSEFSGSGIGLAACKKIVEQYKGQIHVQSTLGEGTTFSIEFPESCLLNS